jgi:hypothetical protein
MRRMTPGVHWWALSDKRLLGLCVNLETEQAYLLGHVSTGPLVTTADLAQAWILQVPQRFRKPPQIPAETTLSLFETSS